MLEIKDILTMEELAEHLEKYDGTNRQIARIIINATYDAYDVCEGDVYGKSLEELLEYKALYNNDEELELAWELKEIYLLHKSEVK